MAKTLTITEYGRIVRGDNPSSNNCLPSNDFDLLLDFINDNQSDDAPRSFRLESTSGRQVNTIRATNYVGVIQFASGDSLEILPKIDGVSDLDSRRLLLEMLSVTKMLPFREFDEADLGSKDCKLHEFFITKYLETIWDICKKGVASAYYDVESNERYVRGHIDFVRNIIENAAHPERFYVGYQLFGVNRPENRLIKSTLSRLRNLSEEEDNIRGINTLLSIFEEIPGSIDIDGDFNKVNIGYGMLAYEQAMRWSRLFLKHKAFDMYKGDHLAYSLLFPMDKLYESYVYQKLQEKARGILQVSPQGRSVNLFDKPNSVEIRPDIVITRDDGCRFIIDTKWKIVCGSDKVSNEDLYQMIVYSEKYGARLTILLYPKSEGQVSTHYHDHLNEIEVNIRTMFLDFKHVELCFDKLVDYLQKI